MSLDTELQNRIRQRRAQLYGYDELQELRRLKPELQREVRELRQRQERALEHREQLEEDGGTAHQIGRAEADLLHLSAELEATTERLNESIAREGDLESEFEEDTPSPIPSRGVTPVRDRVITPLPATPPPVPPPPQNLTASDLEESITDDSFEDNNLVDVDNISRVRLRMAEDEVANAMTARDVTRVDRQENPNYLDKDVL